MTMRSKMEDERKEEDDGMWSRDGWKMLLGPSLRNYQRLREVKGVFLYPETSKGVIVLSIMNNIYYGEMGRIYCHQPGTKLIFNAIITYKIFPFH